MIQEGIDMQSKLIRLYARSVSVEVPDMLSLPRLAVQPNIGVDLQTDVRSAWPGHVECTLTVALHATLQGQTMFMIEVAQSGIFALPPISHEELTTFARKDAASTLFPFVRAHLSALAVCAGFQSIILDHIDFDALITRLRQGQPVRSTPAPPAEPEQPEQQATPKEAQPPSPLPTATAPDLAAEAAPVEAAAKSTDRHLIGLAILLLAGALCFYALQSALLSHKSTHGAASTAPAPAPAPVTEGVVHALFTSAARLREQAPGSYTLELGEVLDLGLLAGTVDLKRQVYLIRTEQGRLMLLYGTFPNKALAQMAAAEVPPRVAAKLRATLRVLRTEEVGKR